MITWPARWSGRWIWYRDIGHFYPGMDLAAADREFDVYAMFRRSFVLDRVPRRLGARITVDGRYVLWVNGREVRRGPVRSAVGTLCWDELDLEPYLVGGENAIAVLVRHYGCPTPTWAPTPRYGAMGAGGLVMDFEEPFAELGTGPEWRAMKGPWEPGVELRFGIPNESLDARELAEGWTGPDFDDQRWSSATVLTVLGLGQNDGRPPGIPFLSVTANPMPPMSGHAIDARPHSVGRIRGAGAASTPIAVSIDPRYWAVTGLDDVQPAPSFPVRLQAGDGLVLDLGTTGIGVIGVQVKGERGTTVELRAGEGLDGALPVDNIRQWLHRRILRGGDETVTPVEAIGLRYLLLTTDGELEVRGASLSERRYPLDDRGEFSSDDESLNAIWRAGRRTLEICATDAFLDCPSREQRAWLGDNYVSSLLALVTSADARLVPHALSMAARCQRADGLLPMVAAGDFSVTPLNIPDYSLQWLRTIARAWEYLGTAAPLREGASVGKDIVDWFWQFVEDGVLQAVPGWVFVDWWPLHGAGRVGSLQGILLLALEDHAAIARALGDDGLARESEARAAVLRKGFDFFRLPSRQAFCEQPETGLVSQHVVAMAILAGAVGLDEGARMLEHVTDPALVKYPVFESIASHAFPPGFEPGRDVLGTQPFFAHWLHQAMARCERRDLMLDSIRRWQQFVDAGDGSIWEFWVEGSGEGSHAHAWAATPTYDLSTHLLGIRPAAPGFARVSLRPWFGPLRRLAGAVPTPHGPIGVDLRREEGQPRGTIELPEGVSGGIAFTEWHELGEAALEPGINRVGHKEEIHA